MKKNERKKEKTIYDCIDQITDKIFNGIVNFSKIISSQKFDDVIKIILKIIFALILTSLLRIPFNLLKYCTDNIFSLFPTSMEMLFNGIFAILTELTYVAFCLVIISVFIKDIALSKINFDFNKQKLTGPLTIFLKILLVILIIPAILLVIVLLGILTIMIINLLSGIYLIGAYLMIIGLIIISIVVITLIVNTLNRGDK